MTVGAIILHGMHQLAQKSTSATVFSFAISLSKLLSSKCKIPSAIVYSPFIFDLVAEINYIYLKGICQELRELIAGDDVKKALDKWEMSKYT